MTDDSFYTVQQTARKCGVSVRTLHYYDAIGLLVPGRSPKGYRLYSQDDILRLQQIVLGRTLGMALEDIRQMLDDPDFDLKTHLAAQRKKFLTQIEDAHKIIASLEAALAHIAQTETVMNIEALFGGFDPQQYEDEAQQRWGDTPQFRESQQKSRQYDAESLKKIQAEEASIWKDAAQALHAGVPATDKKAAQIAERHRQHICRWFYQASPDMHKGLAQMWLSDPRFRETIDRHAKGLTDWIAAAILAV